MFLDAADLQESRCVNREQSATAGAVPRQRVGAAPSTAGRPVVLIASTAWWAFPARIAIQCAARGLSVAAICGRGHALTKTAAVDTTFRYGPLRPLRALAAAIATSKASLVIPCDDRALLHLHRLHATTTSQALRQVVERSLGDPAAFAVLDDRAALAARARGLEIDAPETVPVQNPAALEAAIERLGLPAVLKVDGTWGGFGAIKRLLVDRDAFHMLPWLQGKTPRLSLQAYVPGNPANSVSVCHDGTILSTVCAEAVSVQRPLGASSVIRIIEHPAMADAAEKLARDLKLSGVFGLDFLLDAATGTAQLLEMNARATPLCHLSFGIGRDPVGGIAEIAGLPGASTPPNVTDRDVIAYFPQAWHTAPEDRWLHDGFHDVPWEDPALLKELLRLPWPDRGWLASLRRLFAQPRPDEGALLITNRPVEKT
jgi:hypothetical protein